MVLDIFGGDWSSSSFTSLASERTIRMTGKAPFISGEVRNLLTSKEQISGLPMEESPSTIGRSQESDVSTIRKLLAAYDGGESKELQQARDFMFALENVDRHIDGIDKEMKRREHEMEVLREWRSLLVQIKRGMRTE